MTTYKDTIDIRIDDDETGETTIIPVDVTYLVERDNDYGADADGRRGKKTCEVYILDYAIAYKYLGLLTLPQVSYVLEKAGKTVTEGVRP
ncbi:MAG: hypothetical protein OEY86_07545 [Nitrospira sp.]|nr:hypothetical protein [Nitrospira sp.]